MKMAKDESVDNGSVEFQLDIHELREQLGIDEIEQTIAGLQDVLGQWLTYVNLLDKRVQELSGEAIISENLRFNVNPGGKVQTQKRKPALPSNLLENAPQMVPTTKRGQ
jgi:hypothetical protein